MNRLLARLERRFGRWAISNLALYIVTINAFAWVVEMSRPGFSQLLLLNPEKVRQGEVWRLVTFLFTPPQTSPIWILFCLYFTWLLGMALEAQWGAFKFNVFYFLGALGTVAAALILGRSMSNSYLNTTLLFAFATLFPNFELLIFLILPVKVKWLALLGGLVLANQFLEGPLSEQVAILVALANYLLFFYRDILETARRGSAYTRRLRHRRLFAPPPRTTRICKICGKTDDDRQVDMRVCDCEKCGQPTDYCLEHARNH